MIEMTLEMALTAMSAAQKKAMDLNAPPITVSVVDEAGGLILTARADGAGIFNVNTSQGKAVASVAFRRPSKDLVELLQTQPAYWNALPSLVPGRVLPSTGAVPIEREGRVIGAIGCGGGSADEDHECAVAAKIAVEVADSE